MTLHKHYVHSTVLRHVSCFSIEALLCVAHDVSSAGPTPEWAEAANNRSRATQLCLDMVLQVVIGSPMIEDKEQQWKGTHDDGRWRWNDGEIMVNKSRWLKAVDEGSQWEIVSHLYQAVTIITEQWKTSDANPFEFVVGLQGYLTNRPSTKSS